MNAVAQFHGDVYATRMHLAATRKQHRFTLNDIKNAVNITNQMKQDCIRDIKAEAHIAYNRHGIYAINVANPNHVAAAIDLVDRILRTDVDVFALAPKELKLYVNNMLKLCNERKILVTILDSFNK